MTAQQLMIAALPPLHRKVRAPLVADLATRVEAVSAEHASLPAKLAKVLRELYAELITEEQSAAQLTNEWSQAGADAGKREAVLRGHLLRTVGEKSALRADLKALRRFLSFDALKERCDRRKLRLCVLEETALQCLTGVLQKQDEAIASEVALARWLISRSDESARPPVRAAALQALTALLEAPSATEELHEELSAELSTFIGRNEGRAFLQAEALKALFLVDATAAATLVQRRMPGPYPTEKDFLFRREALNVAAAHLTSDALLRLLDDVLLTDPSEWVRMGACGLLGEQGENGLSLLRRLCATDASAGDRSHLVRGQTVLTLCAQLAADGSGANDAVALLARLLRCETHATVLRIACERLSVIADQLDHRALLLGAVQLREALLALTTRAGTPGVVIEAAAHAALALRRFTDPARLAWTRYLAQQVHHIEVGGKRKVTVNPAPIGLPPLPEDPAFLGGILADLSREGFGLSATRKADVLVLTRGDRFERRIWRIWHELRRPAPNKRQAFVHTVGRVPSGNLRAPPAHLDEITETMVPGERVHVASQGSWGRHVPTVDDLVSLKVTSEEPVRLFSSHGVTTLTPPGSFTRRLFNSVRLTGAYASFASLRLSSLGGAEPHLRRRYVEQVRNELGIGVDFQPYEQSAPSQMVASLFAADSASHEASHKASDKAAATKPDAAARLSIASALLPTAFTDQWRELFDRREYFFGAGGNGPLALALFTALLFTWFLVTAWHQRRALRIARANVPLSIGGWGTRGKSGTERLKAALFGGLGFEVFAKTTGSEAMFVHTAPSGDPTELFIFRPYDKATIWEQRDMLQLGESLHTEVFLWECMALQPSFVELLQNDWMKDDFATLTNAYPDHEDIQGPAGVDIASVITNFIPNDGTVLSSEDHFLPLFKERAKQKNATLIHSAAHEAELIPKEVLALFPYQEHPRNVALVATLAEQLGISRSHAIALMAEHVQPEIGVLKVFPPARVHGRTLTFINGHSANERTGFMNNWLRTGLDAVSCEEHPDQAVITVINNRWDRVARSEVFARLIVEDAPADRHVLIGTNLEGLQKYIRTALDQYLSRAELVTASELSSGAAAIAGRARLARELGRLKIPAPDKAVFLDRLSRFARGATLELSPTQDLLAELETAFTEKAGTFSVKAVRQQLQQKLEAQLRQSLRPSSDRPDSADRGLVEVLKPATADDVVTHALFLLARLVVHARLSATLFEGRGLAELHETFRTAHRELFLEQLVPVPDPHASGDTLVSICASVVGPGVQVSIMGAQNIKGTGLDWVYRWLALDRVTTALNVISKGSAAEKQRAMELLEGFDDSGIVDAGLAAHVLPRLSAAASDDKQAARLLRLSARMAAVHRQRLLALQKRGGATATASVIKGFETVFDYLHSVRRRKLADVVMADLVDGRISHPRAALEMRKLYERQKGGWLLPELQLLRRRLSGKLAADGDVAPAVEALDVQSVTAAPSSGADVSVDPGHAARPANTSRVSPPVGR